MLRLKSSVNYLLRLHTTQLPQIRLLAALAQPNVDNNESLQWKDAKPYKSIPGPTGIRGLLSFMPGGKYHQITILDLYRKFFEEYGPLAKLPGFLGKHDVILSYNPDDYAKIYRTEGVSPLRRGMECFEYYRKKVRPDIFKGMGGLIPEQGEEWHQFRSTVNPVMLQPKIVKLYVPAVEKITQDFIDLIKGRLDDKNEVPNEFGNDVNRWSLESIGCIALDTRLNILDSSVQDEETQKIMENIRRTFELIYQLDVLPSVWKMYKTPKFMKLMATFDYLTNTVMKHVDAAIERLESQQSKDDHEMGVLEKLLKIDRHTAVVMAFDMLVAGVDTTASAAKFTLYLLAKNPDKQAILREELRQIMPTKDTKLTPEKMQNLPYLRACLKESMRILPIVPSNFRGAASDIVLHGYQIPKGTGVVMPNAVLQLNDANFPKSSQFIPERWLKNTTSTECPHAKTAHPFIYLPFGYGPRTCIGRRFAEMEIEVFIAKFIRQFNVEWHHEDMKIETTLLNFPAGELKFRLTKIEE